MNTLQQNYRRANDRVVRFADLVDQSQRTDFETDFNPRYRTPLARVGRNLIEDKREKSTITYEDEKKYTHTRVRRPNSKEVQLRTIKLQKVEYEKTFSQLAFESHLDDFLSTKKDDNRINEDIFSVNQKKNVHQYYPIHGKENEGFRGGSAHNSYLHINHEELFDSIPDSKPTYALQKVKVNFPNIHERFKEFNTQYDFEKTTSKNSITNKYDYISQTQPTKPKQNILYTPIRQYFKQDNGLNDKLKPNTTKNVNTINAEKSSHNFRKNRFREARPTELRDLDYSGIIEDKITYENLYSTKSKPRKNTTHLEYQDLDYYYKDPLYTAPNKMQHQSPWNNPKDPKDDFDRYFEEEQNRSMILYECPHGCGRKFNEIALEKHSKVCVKVFQSKRKVFNSGKQRLIEDQLKLLQTRKEKSPNRTSPERKRPEALKTMSAMPKWKQQSEALRAGLKQARGKKLSYAEYIALQSSVEQQLVPCEFCGRRFNEAAAERHIPFCEKQAKRQHIRQRIHRSKFHV